MTLARGLRSNYCGELGSGDIGAAVALCGWIDRIRDHGEHLSFIDLRDHTGIVQIVTPRRNDLRSEFVVRVTGTVANRPEGTINKTIATGEIEIHDGEIEILSSAATLPFSIDDRLDVEEITRLRYRFLDIRRDKMQRNLRNRALVNSAIRRSLEAQGFTEVETPMLWTPTPEGAREFLVPSRLQPGNFYVLPQSPQIAKQLLMVGGFDRYYQIARCMRDEDLRADRQFEFTQLDLEASFVTQEDIFAFIGGAIAEIVEVTRNVQINEIPRMTWFDAMDKYGVDKPDLRFESPLIDVTEILSPLGVRAFSAPTIKALLAPVRESFTRSRLDALIDRAKALGAKGLAYFKVVEEEDRLAFESPLAKFLEEAPTLSLIERLGAEAGDTIFVVADEWKVATTVLGQIRLELGKELVSHDQLAFTWIVDFPLFDGIDESGKPISAHHPFTMPHADDFEFLESDPLRVRSQSYDLVLNGWELGSGSIRIHRPDIQSKIFQIIGVTDEEAQSRFGFLLDAFKFGAPPHGGFAFGIDRIAAIMSGEDNIREVIAFPKTQSGLDPMTDAPKPVDAATLKNVGLTLAPKK